MSSSLRKYLGGAVTLAFAIGAVSFANAGEETQTEVAKVKPGKISKKKHQDVKLINTIETSDVPGTNQPPKAVRTVVDWPKQFKFNNKKTPTCKTDAAGLGAAPTVSDAKAACGPKSAVSDDKGSSAQIRVGGATSALTIEVDVVAFNGKKDTLFLYSKPKGDFAGIPATILEGKLKKSSEKGFANELDVTIPPLDAGAISVFQVEIPKDKVAKIKKGKKKKKVAYVQGKCKPKQFTLQATTTFDDGSKTTDDHTTSCKPKG